MKQKILITGSNGYIGSVLGPVLVQDGYQVKGIDNNLYLDGTLEPVASQITTQEKDIRDITKQDLEGFDVVIHLAGLSNDPLGELQKQLTYDINTEAPYKIAQLARDAGVKRFIFASSCSVYGEGGDVFLDEQAALNPQTAYAQSKLLAEEKIKTLAINSFSPVFVRAGTVYGVSPRMRFDLVVNIFVRNVLLNMPLKIFGTGTLWRPLIHINDVVQAYKAFIEAPQELIHNEIFNIGTTQENYQVTAIAKAVQESCKNCSIEHIPTTGNDGRNYRVTCERYEKTFSLKPAVKLKDGINELYRSLEKYKKEDLMSSRFVRVKAVQDKIQKGLFDANLKRIQV